METTALEMLPLAFELWKKNQAEAWLDKLSDESDHKPCVFFQAFQGRPGQGLCRVYKLRPLICRLFGFFTVKDKNGKYVYGSCKVIKEKFPSAYEKALAVIAKDRHPSAMTDSSIQILSMATDMSRDMVGINKAAKIALEKIGLFFHYSS